MHLVRRVEVDTTLIPSVNLENCFNNEDDEQEGMDVEGQKGHLNPPSNEVKDGEESKNQAKDAHQSSSDNDATLTEKSQ